MRAGVVMGARLVGSLAALLAIYYLLPVRWEEGQSDLPWLLLDVTLFGAVVGVQLPLIARARYPGLRAIEAMALSIMLFLILFARLYLSADAGDHAAFSQSLDQTTALYFTITVFATVGFGDIVAQTQASQAAGERADAAEPGGARTGGQAAADRRAARGAAQAAGPRAELLTVGSPPGVEAAGPADLSRTRR